ncbi:MAG: YigZ family protein [Bacteroidales bacterium]|nr:YigZ family protein [Bacteroidales bacterium]
MADNDQYRTINEASRGLFRDRGSKFIALAYPVTDPEQVKDIVDSLKKEYHDARHHCYAYMLGPERDVWRINDDGEPSGTAGKPILGQINSAELTDILIVVVRYFGGTLLGVSGLINAYRSAAADAISNSTVITRFVTVSVTITFPYLVINDVMKVLKDESVSQSNQVFDNECTIIVSMPLSMEDNITGRLLKIKGLSLSREGFSSDRP